jgi:tetratricopeptide (TPR) repeat protein
LHIEVVEGVESLINNSLLQQRDGREGGGVGDLSEGEARFWMLETIHEYAREKLAEDGEGNGGEAEALQREHALYFMGLAEESEAQLTGARQAEWLHRLEEEHDNMRTALRWAKEHTGQGVGAEEIGLRIAGALWRFWYVRGYFSEGREQLSRVLAFALTTSSITSAVQPPLSQPSQSSQPQSQRLFRAKALNGAGNLAYMEGDYAAARALHEESLAIKRDLGDKRGIAISLNNLGSVTHTQGDYAAARSLYEESLALARELGDKRGIAGSLNNLGGYGVMEGEYAAARSLYEESLSISRELGDKWGIAGSLNLLGNVASMEGDYAAARSLHEESLAMMRELGDKWDIAISLINLGNVAYREGDYTSARSLHEESLAMMRELGDKRGVATCLAGLGGVAAAAAAAIEQAQAGAQVRAQVERGVRLLGAAEALLEAIGTVLEAEDRMVYEPSEQQAHVVLGEEAFERARQEGRAMTMEQAIAYALENTDEQ